MLQHAARRFVYTCGRRRCRCAEEILKAQDTVVRTHSEYEALRLALERQKKCKIVSPWATDILYKPTK